jgi:nucleoside-diphosphate-sugar epimerase
VLFKGEENQAYNVGNPYAISSVGNLAIMLSHLFFNAEANVGKEKNSGTVYIPNIKKIQDLGWKPKICLKEGFLRTVKSYEYH